MTEVLHPGGGTHTGLIERLKNFFEELLHKKMREAALKKAKDLEKKRRESETREKRDRAEEKRKEEEKTKEFMLRESGQTRVESTAALREIKREEIKARLDDFIRDPKNEKEGSAYIFNELRRDDSLVNNLKALIDRSPAATILIEELVTSGLETHGDAARLINLCRDLYRAGEQVPGGKEAVLPLISAIEARINTLLDETVRLYARQSGIGQIDKGVYLRWFQDNLKYKLEGLTPPQKEELATALAAGNRTAAEPLMHTLLTASPAVSPTQDTSWVDRADPAAQEGVLEPPRKIVEQMDKIWQPVAEAEKAGAHLSTERLQEVYRDILKAESSAYPADLAAGSKTYMRDVRSIHRFAETKLKALSDELLKRLKTETPTVKRGISDPEVFLEEMGLVRQGYLAQLLMENPKMKDLLVGNVPMDEDKINESVHFRNQVFLAIHKRLLTDPHQSSGENFGLYERADFTTFLNVLGSGMARLTKPETGATYGEAWVAWYTNLSSALRLSRDIDYYASQPGVEINNWAQSFTLFKNEISAQALAIPAVEQAYRALETTLRCIRDANDGYIPPGMVEYDPVGSDSKWNSMAEQMLVNMIDRGMVHDLKRDKITGFHVADSKNRGIEIGKKLDYATMRKKDPQRLELLMYMTLGKGFGLSSLRFLEMFANSKVPGSRHPDFGMKNFHSTAYEGPARAMNYINTVLHKWSFGSYKYLQIMNTLLPEGHKIPANDAKQAQDAYNAYMDGTFEDKYGHEAKRLFDKLNFSRMTSGFSSNYTFRQFDTTIGWSDKQRELLGGPIKIIFKNELAEGKVKEYLVESKYKQAFREKMQAEGKATAGWEFDALWKNRYQPRSRDDYQIEEEFKALKKQKWVQDLIKAYEDALVARSLVETAARNPLAIAHAINVKVKDTVTGKERRVNLHNLIVHQILGIPPEYTKYGDMHSQAAEFASPTPEQLQYTKEIVGLESDIAAVREIAINGIKDKDGKILDEGNRDLKEEDFTIIENETRRRQAIRYWRLTQEALFGRHSAAEMYRELGMEMGENGKDYDLDWDKIKKAKEEVIDKITKEQEVVFPEGILPRGEKITAQLKNLVEKDWKEEIIIGTDSTAFRQMDFLNLGGRQWVRLAGDAAAHFQGGQRVGKYLATDLNANPNPHELAKALLEIRQIYEGDNIDIGWRVASYLTTATAKLYSFDFKRLGSPAQLYVWKTRKGIAGWNANHRRKFLDACEHLDVLPPTADAWGYNIPDGEDIHHLKKMLRADNKDVWFEIVTLGLLLITLLTLYRALTAKSEEEDDKGG